MEKPQRPFPPESQTATGTMKLSRNRAESPRAAHDTAQLAAMAVTAVKPVVQRSGYRLDVLGIRTWGCPCRRAFWSGRPRNGSNLTARRRATRTSRPHCRTGFTLARHDASPSEIDE